MKEFFNKIAAAFLSFIISFLGFFGVTYNPVPEKDSLANTDASVTRIMSFNIRCNEYDRRKNLVPGLIEAYAPDSAGLQECTYQWYKNLTESLEDYAFVGVGRDTGDLSEDCGEISAIIYKKTKYNLIDSGTFWLSETPDEVSRGWDGACNRICTWVVLENKETGEKYAHVNTHLDHMGTLARQNGLELIRNKALSYDIPTVVTGDFNFNKGTDLYNSLVTGGLKDTQDIAPDTMDGKTYHGYSGGEAGKPIDFICVNDKITDVKSYTIIREKYELKYTSDHYPIYSDMVM
ncbi:MAG: endonuclease/exonuclease/phosphatase family protein [Clostridia bacterium]|nr:endonuclease/exonuclease/phosphatase family protein [Clostridia bacterium]